MVDDQVIKSIHYMLGQIDGKVTLLVDQGKIQDDRHSSLETRVRSLESESPHELEPRVRKLETRIAWYSGVSAAIGAGGAYVVKTFLGHSP